MLCGSYLNTEKTLPYLSYLNLIYLRYILNGSKYFAEFMEIQVHVRVRATTHNFTTQWIHISIQ